MGPLIRSRSVLVPRLPTALMGCAIQPARPPSQPYRSDMPAPLTADTLTPLGAQLRRQARDYIGLSVSPGQQTSNITP
jgi:hypothetical protein